MVNFFYLLSPEKSHKSVITNISDVQNLMVIYKGNRNNKSKM